MWRSRIARVVVTIAVQAAVASRLCAGQINVGPGGEFPDIQPAIDAAADGDVILVEPGTYTPFRLAKGVVIRAAVAGQRFDVQSNATAAWVVVENTSASQKAGISGMRLLPAQVEADWEGFLWLENCQGEVLLENISIAMDMLGARNRRLFVDSCANVAIVDLQAFTWSMTTTTPRDEGTVQVFTSRVRISDSIIQAGYGFRQAAGLEVADSILVLSSTNVIGGGGEPCGGGGSIDGGDGIRATDSQVMAIGSATHLIKGGEGGSGGECQGPGGEGGAGFRGNSAMVSIVSVKGGKGGYGGPFEDPGEDGPDWDGDLTRNDVIPYLTVTGDLQTGDSVDMAIHTVEAGLAVLVVGTESGFVVDTSKVGPPLSVIPGGLFIARPVGAVDPNDTRIIRCTIPGDPLLVGLSAHVQGAIVGTSTTFLTNAVSRVFGE